MQRIGRLSSSAKWRRGTVRSTVEEATGPLRNGKNRNMKHVRAVIFDWAGTVVDYGSLAPMGAFVETFGAVRRRDLDRRGARPHGDGEAAPYRGPDGAAARGRRLGGPARRAARRARHRRRLLRLRPQEHGRRGALLDRDPRGRGRGGGPAGRRRQDRVDHRLYPVHHGRDHARRRRARFRARQPRLHRRYGGRPTRPPT